MNSRIAALRKEYIAATLSEVDAASNAIQQFSLWWADAVKTKIDEVNAMTLATASKAGIPSARIVLLKGFDETGFVFFTNYKSRKGRDLEENSKAALIFFWKELERQVRIEGSVSKLAEKESDAYFNSRPAGSKIGTWASPQSEVIAERKVLEENIKKFRDNFKEEIPRPPHWGGYVVNPAIIEFWQGRSNRLHDRLRYTKLENKNWRIERLAP